jgi:signal transduction histidine kinase
MSNFTKSRWNQFWSKLPTAYRGALIIGIPVIAILPAIASWSWSIRAKSDAYWWVNHTQEVIQESNNLMTALIDAETGIRGYTITQKPGFLEPYNRIKQETPTYLLKLEKLTKDNSRQQQQLELIEQQIKNRFDIFKQDLNVLQLKSSNNYQSPELFIDGKTAMDKIKNSLDSFRNEEWKLLTIRQNHLKKINRITNILLGTSMGLTLFAYGLAVKLYYQAQKEIEQKLKELDLSNKNLAVTNQLIKERNQELDQFTYIVSHDLKAPLRAISNLSEWIEEDLADKLDQDATDNMALLRNRVLRMNNFIDGLLEYSRIGKVQGKNTSVDVQKLLLEIIDSIAPPSEFVINISDQMPILQTEALALQQVFSNLINNAIKHHDREDGTITINAQEQQQHYQFSVADNGQGIAPEYQEKVFVIFETLAAKDTKENTGIGLSIVKKIVEKQGGKIWLESKLNQGTTFYFTWKK